MRVGAQLPGAALDLVDLAAVGGDEEAAVLGQRMTGDGEDGVDLVADGLGLIQAAVEDAGHHQQTQRDRQHGEAPPARASSTCRRGQGAHRLGVPQVLAARAPNHIQYSSRASGGWSGNARRARRTVDSAAA